MKTTRLMRLLIGMLAAVMLLGCVLTSCTNDNTPNTDKPDNHETETTSEDDLFEDMRNLTYSGEEFNVFTYKSEDWFQYFEELEGGSQRLNEATYERNGIVEELFDIDIMIETAAGNRDTVIMEFMTKSLAGGAEIPDLVVPFATETITGLLAGGYLADIKNVDYMNLTADYYNQSVNENFTFMGKQYCFVSDYTYALQQRFAYLANVDMIDERGVLDELETEADSIYELVTLGEWTWENLGLMIANIYSDNGSEDIANATFGLTVNYNTAAYTMNNWGVGLKLVTPTDDGFAFSLYSLDIQDRWDDLLTLVNSTDAYLDSSNDYYQYFQNGRAMFSTYSSDPWNLTQEPWNKIHFAYLPYPKYQAEDEYITTAHGGLMFIPAGAKDIEMVGAVVEALSRSSEIYIREAYIQYYFEGRVIQDAEGVEIYELIRDAEFFGFTRYVDPSSKVGSAYYIEPLKKNIALSTYNEQTGDAIQRAYNALVRVLK